MKPTAGLKRSFGLGALFVYGLGDILGAGIYALIGKVAAQSGYYSWLSFLIALIIAMLTALSYGELTRRLPKSGGASYYVQQAFSKDIYAFLTGWLLLCVSIVSMATLSSAFVGYASAFGLEWSPTVLIAIFLIVLALINLWGIEQSSTANIISTSIEVSGLLVVVAAAIYFLGGDPEVANSPLKVDSLSKVNLLSILQGAALAFYAFIGFEDLANVAEEAKQPEKDLPKAIIASLIVAGLFYVFIGWISTAVLEPAVLAKSSNPLTDIVEKSGIGFPLKLFGVIAIFAVANTCLLNFITGSRLLYGMASEKLVPRIFEKVHERFKTPYVAILAILPLSFLLAATSELKVLAGITSVLILLVFCATNLSLIRLKKKSPSKEGFTVFLWVPCLALLTNLGLIAMSEKLSLGAAVGFIIGGLLVYGALKKFGKGFYGK